MLGDKEEADDGEETEEGDVETAHREREKKKLFLMVIVLRNMRGMISMSSH